MKFDDFKEKIESLSPCMLSKNHLDGRVNSIANEQEVIEHLEKYLFNSDENFQVAPPRHWYDCSYQDIDGNFAPINIKVTSGHGNDNISSKAGMYYALTGYTFEEMHSIDRNAGNLVHWGNYNKSLASHFCVNDKDYYFIIYFKNSNKFLVTSLKRISSLVSNGNNLPFQCNWSNNMDFTNRTVEEQSHYIMNVFIDSFKKRSQGIEYLFNWKEQNNNGE